MKFANMPFVAIIGGLWQFDSTQFSAAKAVGEEIGEELAKAGFALVWIIREG
jgi:ribosomal protein L18